MASVGGMDLAEIVFDQIDMDNYDSGGPKGGGKSFGPPPKGKYFMQNPVITDASFGQTQAGYLSVTVDPVTVKLPDGTDYAIKFTRLSAKKYSNRQGSQILDWLRASGIDARPTNAQELMTACKMASGRTFEGGLDWEGYVERDSEFNKRGMENFPKAEDGKYQPFYAHPYEDGKRVWANARITYFVDAVKKG